MSSYVETDNHSRNKMKVELDLSKFATKYGQKKQHMLINQKLLKSQLVKYEVDELDIDKLKSVPIDLGEPSNEVKNDAVKKNVYNEFVAKVNTIDYIDTTKLVKKKLTTTQKLNLVSTNFYFFTKLQPLSDK